MASTLKCIAVLGLVVVAAGCGSDDGDSAAERPAGAATLSVTETDFAIDPAKASVKQSGDVRVTVVNRGKVPHALAIETPDGIVKTDTLAAGQSGQVETNLDDGTYDWFCPIGDHRARGMEGELKVGSGDGGDDSSPGGGYGY